MVFFYLLKYLFLNLHSEAFKPFPSGCQIDKSFNLRKKLRHHIALLKSLITNMWHELVPELNDTPFLSMPTSCGLFLIGFALIRNSHVTSIHAFDLRKLKLGINNLHQQIFRFFLHFAHSQTNGLVSISTIKAARLS